MTDGEKVFLAVAAVGLVAALLYKTSPTLELVAVEPDASSPRVGPSWLSYNYPWRSNGVVGNVMPSISNGQVGQVQSTGTFTNFSYNPGCGCGA